MAEIVVARGSPLASRTAAAVIVLLWVPAATIVPVWLWRLVDPGP